MARFPISNCRHSDLIVEAIIEKPEAKQHLFARLEPLLKRRHDPLLEHVDDSDHATGRWTGASRAILRSALLQSGAADAAGGSDSRQARRATRRSSTAAAYARTLGKSPIVMNDGPGFLVNRLLLPYMNEAALLLGEGASIKEIERAAKDFGMPMGPITLYDVVGIDVAVHAGRTMAAAFPDRVVPAPIVDKLFELRPHRSKSWQRLLRLRPAERRQTAARHR